MSEKITSVTENTVLPTRTCKSPALDNGGKPVIRIVTWESLPEGNSEGDTDKTIAVGCGMKRSFSKSKLCIPKLADELLAILIFVLTTLSNGGIKISIITFSASEDKTLGESQVRGSKKWFKSCYLEMQIPTGIRKQDLFVRAE